MNLTKESTAFPKHGNFLSQWLQVFPQAASKVYDPVLVTLTMCILRFYQNLKSTHQTYWAHLRPTPEQILGRRPGDQIFVHQLADLAESEPTSLKGEIWLKQKTWNWNQGGLAINDVGKWLENRGPDCARDASAKIRRGHWNLGFWQGNIFCPKIKIERLKRCRSGQITFGADCLKVDSNHVCYGSNFFRLRMGQTKHMGSLAWTYFLVTNHCIIINQFWKSGHAATLLYAFMFQLRLPAFKERPKIEHGAHHPSPACKKSFGHKTQWPILTANPSCSSTPGHSRWCSARSSTMALEGSRLHLGIQRASATLSGACANSELLWPKSTS